MSVVLTYFKEFGEALWEIMKEMSPYLLLGFLFAGILYIWFPKNKVHKYLGKRNSVSVFYAALLGIPLPLCSCGVIPTGISFYNSGASKGSSVSFLISTPQTGADSIMVTYSLLGLPMAILKPIIALFTGFLGGFLTNIFEKNNQESELVQNKFDEEKQGIDRSLKGMLRYAFIDFLEDIAKWLVIGLLIASLIDVIVPESFFTAYLGNDYLEMLLILVAAIPLYVCATGSIPIAAMLMLKGLSPGAAIVFLLAGPATNAATITVIGKVLGKRTLSIYLISIITGALFFGMLINELLPREWFTGPLQHIHGESHEHGILPQWIQIGSTILLTFLILNVLIKKYVKRLFQSKSNKTVMYNNSSIMNELTVSVKGMTCNHCKATVEENIGKIPGIKSVNADIVSGKVKLTGDKFDLDQIRFKVESIGYNWGGVVKKDRI
jgi:uncharacterized membrane protein YraQ (UPF0718 family)/copper chaperone CopZ